MENKTYYDWLEVSPKASPEVIEKAYKALVIKYHPDLQKNNNQESEIIIRKINEAYDVLSNPVKRTEYDTQLNKKSQSNYVSKDDYYKLQQELNLLKQKQNNSIKSSQYYSKQQQSESSYSQQELKKKQYELEKEYYNQIQTAQKKAYHDAYIEDLKNRGYRIKYKKSLKYYLKLTIICIIILLILWILWKIPFIHNYIVNLSNDNIIIKIFVEIIKSIYEAFYKAFIN